MSSRSRLTLALGLVLWGPTLVRAQEPAPSVAEIHPHEVHLKNLRQISFGGENAEAYWSPDGQKLIFQSSRGGAPCDQEFVFDVVTGVTRRVSNGQGRTTCGYFYEGGKRVLYASTHLASAECPPRPDFSKGYVWALYPGFDGFPMFSPDGKTLVFASNRGGKVRGETNLFLADWVEKP